MRVLRRKLQAAGLPFKIRVFDGGHDWPTADICTEAIEWMEIQAMKSGKREKDAALIEELFQKRLKKAEEEKINGLLHQAADEFQSITSDFKSLRDVDSVSAEASQLKEVDVVKQWEQEEAKRDQTDLDFQQKMASVNRSIRNSTRKVPKKEDVLKFLEVEELKKKAKEAKSIDDRLQAKRLLTVVAIQNGFYLPRSLWEYGDYERLELTLSIATEIRPEEPYTWYALACAEAQLGKKEQAIDALKHAVEHGFKNAEKMETDFHLRSLQDEKQFKEIVKHLKQQQAS
jgi:tetratricopeptide (TPR) repeat protein